MYIFSEQVYPHTHTVQTESRKIMECVIYMYPLGAIGKSCYKLANLVDFLHQFNVLCLFLITSAMLYYNLHVQYVYWHMKAELSYCIELTKSGDAQSREIRYAIVAFVS